MTLRDGHLVSLLLDHSGDNRSMSITAPGSDKPAASATFTLAEAVILASLLGGLRLIVERSVDRHASASVGVQTVVIGSRSPAAGCRLTDLDVRDPERARAIAVIRDDTEDLLELDPDRPCRPGDRLVLVGRPGALEELSAHLAG